MFKLSNLLSLLFILCLSSHVSYGQNTEPVRCGPAQGGSTDAVPFGSSLCTNGNLLGEIGYQNLTWTWSCNGTDTSGSTSTMSCYSFKIDENVVPMDNEYSPGVGQSTQIEIDGTCQQITNNHTEKIYLPFEVASVTVANYNKLLAAGIISVTPCALPVDGVCNNGTQNSCSAGTASALPDTTTHNWICNGVNGGNPSVTCTAPLTVSGLCGSADGVAVTSAPSLNLCSVGVASAVAGTGPWTWDCSGTACSAPVAGDVIFVTAYSTRYTGNLGGINGANDKCVARATAAGLADANSFRAVLSDSKNNAKDMFRDGGKLVNVPSVATAPLASSLSVAFASGLDSAILYDENGNANSPATPHVYTGSNPRGELVVNENCSDWTDGTVAASGRNGALDDSATWLDMGLFTCDRSIQLYCTDADISIVNGNCSEVQDQCLAGTVANINGGANTWDCTGLGGGATDSCSLSTGDDTIFITSTAHRGSLGGINGANGICQTRATAGGLPNANTFRAILSDSKNNAKDMFAVGGQVKNMESDNLASDIGLAFSAGLSSFAITYDENGSEYTATNGGISTVFTGSIFNGEGVAGLDCDDWTRGNNSGGLAILGSASETTYWLQFGGGAGCDESHRLYCTDAAVGLINGNCSASQDQCLAGTVANINGGANTWDCAGVGGGATDSCTLPVDGTCGTATAQIAPTGGTNLCASGSITNWVVGDPETWDCEGTGGGTTESGCTTIGGSLTFSGATHSAADCTAAGGVVYNTGATGTLCQLSAATCPVGWSQADYWSTTTPGTATWSQAASPAQTYTCNGVTVTFPATGYADSTMYPNPSHSWSNTEKEWHCYANLAAIVPSYRAITDGLDCNDTTISHVVISTNERECASPGYASGSIAYYAHFIEGPGPVNATNKRYSVNRAKTVAGTQATVVEIGCK